MSNQSTPDIVGSIHETATSLEDQVEKLESFRDDLETTAEQVERMGERERAAFYSNASSLRNQIEGIETVEELLSLDEKLEELVRSPLREAALAELDSFLDLVDPQLSKDTREEVHDKVRSSIPQDLEEITAAYQELSPQVDGLPGFLQEQIRAAIEDRPSVLTDPTGGLSPLVEQLERRQRFLLKFDEQLAAAGDWTPEGSLAEEPRLYRELNTIVASGQAKKTVAEIDERLNEIGEEGLYIEELVQQEIERELDNSEPDTLLEPFTSINGELYALRDTYLRVSSWASELEAFGTDQSVYEAEIDDLLTEYRQLELRTFDSVKALRERCHQTERDIGQFISTLVEQLNVQRRMVQDIKSELDGVAPPEIEFAADGTGRVTDQSVRNDLNGALSAVLTHDEWFEDVFSELGESFDSEAAFEIWQQLYDGESVALTSENKETILALAERFSVRVVLGSE